MNVVPFAPRDRDLSPASAFPCGELAVCGGCGRHLALYQRANGSRVVRLHNSEPSERDGDARRLRGVLCPGSMRVPSRRISSARSAPSTPPAERAA